MDVLGFVTLTVTGFASCAEFSSYGFVHPVIRHLPREPHIRVEQGLLQTFGRVMPCKSKQLTGPCDRSCPRQPT